MSTAIDGPLALGLSLQRGLLSHGGGPPGSPIGRPGSLTPPTPISMHPFPPPSHRSLLDPSGLKTPKYGGGSSSGPIGNLLPCPSPPPASSNPENNACRLIDYRGARVAAFNVDGRQLICLPQAFELFLKHLVGGLHTVYTKLKRLDITPVVCNVEQVRVLRGLGAIQPGVNRCKLISPAEFDILYDDCTNSSARPGRPPKRSALNATPDALDNMKKNRTLLGQMTSQGDYFSPVSHIVDAKKVLHHHHQLTGNPFSAGPNPSNGSSTYNQLMSFAADLHKSSAAAALLGGPTAAAFPYPPHLAAAAAAAGHFAFMPLAAATHPGMMNFAVANHFGSMRAAAAAQQQADHVTQHGLQPDMTTAQRSRGGAGDVSRLVAPPSSRSDEFNNNNNNNNTTSGGRATGVQQVLGGKATGGGYSDHLGGGGGTGDSLDRPLNLETHKRSNRLEPPSQLAGSASGSEADSCSVVSGSSDRHSISGQLDLTTQKHNSAAVMLQYENEARALKAGKDHDRNSATDPMSADEDENEDSDGYIAGMRVASRVNGALENGNDVMLGGAAPDLTSSLEALFANIQGLLKMAVEKSRDREEQISYEKVALRQKVEQERELRETIAKRLLEEQKLIETLERRLEKERKARHRLEVQLHQQTADNRQSQLLVSPSGERTAHSRYASYSAGGSTDDEENTQQLQQQQQWLHVNQSKHSSGERSRSSSSNSSCCGGPTSLEGTTGSSRKTPVSSTVPGGMTVSSSGYQQTVISMTEAP